MKKKKPPVKAKPKKAAKPVEAKAKPSVKTILAVAYLRKSQRESQTASEREQEEKSIADQRGRIAMMVPLEANSEYRIVKEYEDVGVPGWKRGAARPGFQKLVDELSQTQAIAILTDDADRFSRASEMETLHDTQHLIEHHGLRFIHCCNQGCLDFATDEFAAMRLAMWAMSSHAHSTRLGRRIAEARIKAAKMEDGPMRSGGYAPYAMVVVNAKGKIIKPGERPPKGERGCSLKPGDPEKVEVVKWIFREFVGKMRSINDLAGHLNDKKVNGKKVPPPRGSTWFVSTVKRILQQPAYAGYFSYNAVKGATFFVTDKEHKVVPANRYEKNKERFWRKTDEGRVLVPGVYTPRIISEKLFQRAQERFKEFADPDNPYRPRTGSFALGHVLYCGHCGGRLFGCHPTGRDYNTYRCNSQQVRGKGACQAYEVREDRLLPTILAKLHRKIRSFTAIIDNPPEHLVAHRGLAERKDRRRRLENERTRKAAEVDKAKRNMALADAEVFPVVAAEFKALRAELAAIERQLEEQPEKFGGHTREELKELNAFWDECLKEAVSVAIPAEVDLASNGLFQDPFSEGRKVLFNPAKINAVLTRLGCRIEVFWESRTITIQPRKKGKGKRGEAPVKKTQQRHPFLKATGVLGLEPIEILGSLPLTGSVLTRSPTRYSAAKMP